MPPRGWKKRTQLLSDEKRKGKGKAFDAAAGIETRIVAKEIQNILAAKGISMEAVSKEVRRIKHEKTVAQKKTGKVIALIMRTIERRSLLTPEFVGLLVAELSKKVGAISGVLSGSDLEAGLGGEAGIDDVDREGTRAPPRALSKEELSVRNELVLENRGLVGFTIKRFFSAVLATELVRFDDMLQYGMIGLIKAAERYDPGKAEFSTYAVWWIRQSIDRGIKDSEYTIRVPIHRIEEFHRNEKISREKITDAFLRGEEENVHLEESELSKFKTVSLNGLVGEKNDREMGELIPSPLPTPEENAILFHGGRRRRNLMTLLESRLSVAEWHVLKRRFGIGDDIPRTLEEIGAELGVSREYIRQIETRALQCAKEILKEKNGRFAVNGRAT